MVDRPNSKDLSTRVAENFAQRRLSNVSNAIRRDNPVGFGQEELTADQYRKRILGMSKEQRLAEIDAKGIDVVAAAMEKQ